jgi:integrase
MQAKRRRAAEGVWPRHKPGCPARNSREGRCRCTPTYQAAVWSGRERKRIRREFATLAAAKAWRQDAQVALRQGTMRAPTTTTIGEAADEWLVGARAGTIFNRKREPYKPSALRSYERVLKLRVLPAFGHLRLSALERNDVQDLVDRMLAQGYDPSTIKNTLNPLQAIYRRALKRGEIAINPTHGLDIPRPRGRRERIASPVEAEALIAALPREQRALWATAMYAGLRRSELRALRWRDVNLASGLIRVERAWDNKEGPIEGKTRAARRSVPIAGVLRDHLIDHRMSQPGEPDALVFGVEPDKPFEPSTINRRARAAWQACELAPIGLHECRHTFASLMIACGVNAKALSTYMGHASVSITFDRYGHLMPGNEHEAARALDSYLAAAKTRGETLAID